MQGRTGPVGAVRCERVTDAALARELDSPLGEHIIALGGLLEPARKRAHHRLERLPRPYVPQDREVVEPSVVHATPIAGERQRPDRPVGVLVLLDDDAVPCPRDADHTICTSRRDERWLCPNRKREHRALMRRELNTYLSTVDIEHAGGAVNG